MPKGKTNLDLNEAKDDCVVGWQWHQLDHVHTICTLLQTDNHTNTSSLNFYRPDALSDAQPTVSKHWREQTLGKNCGMLTFPAESLQNLHSAHRVMQSGAVEPFRPRNLVSFGILAPKISYSALYWCCFMTKLRTVPPHAPAVFQCLWWIKKKSRVLLLSLFNSLGQPGWACTRKVKPVWMDLNEARDDGILGCSGISWTICKQSAPCCRQITTPTCHHSIFTGRMLFLTPNQ